MRKYNEKGLGWRDCAFLYVNLLAIKRILYCQVLSHKTLKMARGINMIFTCAVFNFVFLNAKKVRPLILVTGLA
jgi:hypothetical protein